MIDNEIKAKIKKIHLRTCKINLGATISFKTVLPLEYLRESILTHQ